MVSTARAWRLRRGSPVTSLSDPALFEQVQRHESDLRDLNTWVRELGRDIRAGFNSVRLALGNVTQLADDRNETYLDRLERIEEGQRRLEAKLDAIASRLLSNGSGYG